MTLRPSAVTWHAKPKIQALKVGLHHDLGAVVPIRSSLFPPPPVANPRTLPSPLAASWLSHLMALLLHLQALFVIQFCVEIPTPSELEQGNRITREEFLPPLSD